MSCLQIAKILQFLSFVFLRGWSDSQVLIFEPNDALQTTEEYVLYKPNILIRKVTTWYSG